MGAGGLRHAGASSGLGQSRARTRCTSRPEGVDVIGGPEVLVDFGERLLNSFQMSRSFGTFSLDTVADDAKARVRTAQFEAATRGELHAVVHDVLPLEQAADAHRQMDEGRVFGRIVLTPGRA